jgi:DNA modification methylase
VIQRLASGILILAIRRLAPGYVGTQEESDALVAGINEAVRELAVELDLVTWRVDQGDCLDVMAAMPAASVDAIVTDPPYGLGFMGKAWDALPPGVEWAEACLRVLKPGGYMVAFGGTRTYHRLACAVEDGGFEIRDQLQWLYGSGFPKGKACLKPAHEPIVLARKPAARMTALNVDGCRIEALEPVQTAAANRVDFRPGQACDDGYVAGTGREYREGGRWPANVVLDEEAAAVLDAQTGDVGANGGQGSFEQHAWMRKSTPQNIPRDKGGASRFYYVAKASTRERNAGLDAFEARPAGIGDERPAGSSWERRAPEKNPNHPRRNTHATVKPVNLMRWLTRLITPEGGTILDPMCGSGTTGIAARLEGFSFIGIEREPEYVQIARARIAHWEPEPALFAA